MNLQVNYYSILGVHQNSDSNTIKKAYYKLSMKHHPDKGGDAIVFNQINEAYEILIDLETRNAYDKKSKFGANYDELSELLNYEFDNLAKAWKEDVYDDFKKKELLNIVVRVDDTFDGKVEYERWMLCKKCDGSGKDLNSKIQIKDSKGNILRIFDAQDGCDFCEGTGLDWQGSKCTFCFGQGKIGSTDCDLCGGQKRILSKQKLSGIKFPEDSDELKIECMGNFSKDAPGRVGHLWILRNVTTQTSTT
jgi:DnaJ-class molecular chaperone